MNKLSKVSRRFNHIYFCELNKDEDGVTRKALEEMISEELAEPLGFKPMILINPKTLTFDLYHQEVLIGESCFNFIDLNEIKRAADLAETLQITVLKRAEKPESKSDFAFFETVWKKKASKVKTIELTDRNRIFLNSMLLKALISGEEYEISNEF